jgi:integrase
MNATSVAMTVTQLYNGACIIAPHPDLGWLKALKRRLHARAQPQDRFERLVPAYQTLDLGITLMETLDTPPISSRVERDIQFRDGLILSMLSLWPIRRRSLAALTLHRHFKRVISDDHIEILLFPEDTKSQRMESWPVPEILLPYMRRYLEEVRPRLAGRGNHDAFWVGQRGHPLSEGGLYGVVCRRTAKAYGLSMSPHDFRRSAATFLAMDTPDKVGLTSGVLQHSTPETGDRYYNLSRSIEARRRHSEVLSTLRTRLRPAPR